MIINKKSAKAIENLLTAEAELLEAFGYKRDTTREAGTYWLDGSGGSLFQRTIVAGLRQQLRDYDILLSRKGV